MFWMQGPARSQEDDQQHSEKSSDEARREIDPCRVAETPGICGISVLKRSDEGWPGIGLGSDSILKTEKVDSPDRVGIFDRENLGISD